MSVDSLAEALRNFKGGVILVSHDQRFIDMVCNEIWVCDNKTVTKFPGETIKEYRDTLNIPQ
jgi:ATP-binding cassette subfamily F protein 3